MEQNKYRIFLEVAAKKNLSQVAAELGYTQSGISHTLRRMEDEIGLTLFERGRNGAELTSAGRELLPYITQIVQCQENLDQAIDSLHDLQKGSLSIGVYSSISREWLPDIIRRFKLDFPEVKIHFMEGGNEEIVQWIQSKEVDIGIFSSPADAQVVWMPLAEDPLLAILPLAEENDEDGAMPLTDFNAQTFIISAEGVDVDIHRALDAYGITPDIQYFAKDDYTIVSMVACGLGISILPQLVVQQARGRIRTKTLFPPVSRQLGIAVQSMELVSPAASKFIEYVQDYVAQLKTE